MPWWLLGISMVATTFSADTPNLVTNIVRVDGISGNWQWWAFLITGMMTVFYAKLWRRSEVLTDLEFYELRYSGGVRQKFLRAFRSIYLGVFFNVMIMATVCLAGIKIGGILLGLSPFECVFYSSLITVTYSTLGGLRSVIITDLIQFFVAMVGSIWACIYILNLDDIGGLDRLIIHQNITDKLSFSLTPTILKFGHFIYYSNCQYNGGLCGTLVQNLAVAGILHKGCYQQKMRKMLY